MSSLAVAAAHAEVGSPSSAAVASQSPASVLTEQAASIAVADLPESLADTPSEALPGALPDALPETPAEPAASVLAISDIIRTAADHASATWRVPSVPAQRRESPVVPYKTIATPAAPAAPAVAAAPQLPLLPPPRAEQLVAVPEPESPAADVDSQEPGAQDIDADRDSADRHWPNARRQIALLVRGVTILILAVLVGHRFLPDVLGFGSLIDTFLPWTFVPLALAVPAALLSLDAWAIGVTVLACGVWGGVFGPQLVRSGGSGPADLRILSQNVSSPPDLAAIARLAEQRQADVVVLQGLSSRDAQLADQAVPARYRYHLALYEFAVWSRFQLVNGSVPMDLAAHPADAVQAPSSVGATSGQFGGVLRFTVQLDPARTATLYAVHLPQPSLSHDGFGVARGQALGQLVAAVTAEQSPNLVVVGDLDLAQTDRGMSRLLNSSTGLQSVQAKAGEGFGFTWPAGFPMVRLDDVLTRGLIPVRSVVLPAVGARQAHRPIEADLRFPAAGSAR